MPWTEPPEADVLAYVDRISSLFGVTTRELQDIIAGVNVEHLSQSEQNRINREATALLADLEAEVVRMAENAVDEVYEHGRSRALVALGIFATIGAAKRYLRDDETPTSNLHRRFIAAEKEVFVDDLLAATGNTKRRVRRTVREVAAQALRLGYASRTTRQIIERDLRRRLGESADFAIRDAMNRRWRLRTYAEMVARTKLTETHLESTRNEAIERGALYAVVSQHADACELCVPWEGAIVRLTEDAPGGYPTLDEARAEGLFHPNCLHSISPVRDVNLLPTSIRNAN